MRVVPVLQTLLVVLPLTNSVASFVAPALAADKDRLSASPAQTPSERTDHARSADNKADRTNLGKG